MADVPGKKYFDIAKPGTGLPETSSRPLVVTNRPIVQDPTMTQPVDDKQAQPFAISSEQSTQNDQQSVVQNSQEEATVIAENQIQQPDQDQSVTPQNQTVVGHIKHKSKRVKHIFVTILIIIGVGFAIIGGMVAAGVIPKSDIPIINKTNN